jgi:hypothetical protein
MRCAGAVEPKQQSRRSAATCGIPARTIRLSVRQDQIQALLRIAWWNWPELQVIDEVDVLCSNRADEFIRRFDRVAGGRA